MKKRIAIIALVFVAVAATVCPGHAADPPINWEKVGDLMALTPKSENAAFIINGRTYLPARYVAEALGYKVGWDATTQTVSIADAQ